MSTHGRDQWIFVKVRNGYSDVLYHETVLAEVVGPFALHRPVNRYDVPPNLDHAIAISHVASGHRVFHARTRTQARRAASALAKLADWAFTDPKTVIAWPESLQARIRQIRDHALQPRRRRPSDRHIHDQETL